MSKLVDERVVEMKFDNRDFERNTRQSMSTIQKLKASLNFSGVSNSVQNSVKSVDFNPITVGLEKAGKSFSAWEVISITAISNVTNRAVDAGIALTKSLSVDNVSAGWQKFNQQTKNAGTIISQLTNSMSPEDASKLTEEYIEKIKWYADATSYSIDDMTSAIGKFIAKGKDMDTSFKASVGIANWAASAGKSASDASGAFEALSKVTDHVLARQWYSIQAANMDTMEFKKAALEAAAAMGTLDKSAERFDGTIEYLTKKGNVVTAENFTDAFADGWFTMDALLKVLGKYGSAVEPVMELQNELGLSTPFEALDKFAENAENAANAAKDLGDAEKLATAEQDKFAAKVFKSASEARTYEDAIKAVKDAVSTGWSNVFENIIGKKEEATDFFSTFADQLTGIFTKPTVAINKSLSVWRGYTKEVQDMQNALITKLSDKKDLEKQIAEESGAEKQKALKKQLELLDKEIKAQEDSINELVKLNDHRKDLLGQEITEVQKDGSIKIIQEQGALWNLFDALNSIIDAIKKAWQSLFPIKKTLSEITPQIRDWSKRVKETIQQTDVITKVSRGFFGVLKLGLRILQGIKIAVQPIINAIKGDGPGLIHFIANISDKFADWASNTQIFVKIGNKVASIITKIIDTLKELKIIERISTSVKKLFEEFKLNEELKNTWNSIKTTLNNILDFAVNILTGFINVLGKYVIPALAHVLKYAVAILGYVVSGIIKFVGLMVDTIKTFVSYLKSNEKVQNAWSKIVEFLKSIPDRLKKLGPFFQKLGSLIMQFASAVWNAIIALGKGIAKLFNLKSIGDLFVKIGHAVSSAIHNVINAITELVSPKTTSAVDNTAKKLSPLQTLIKGIKDLCVGLWNVIKALIPIIGRLLSAIGAVFTTLANSLNKTFSKDPQAGGGINLGWILAGGLTALIITGLYNLFSLFKAITVSITDLIFDLGKVIRAQVVRQWALAIKEIAISMLILVGAILLITTIDPAELARAVGVITTLLAEIGTIVAVLVKFAKQTSSGISISKQGISVTSSGFMNVASMFTAIGASIIMLAIALKIVDSINKDRITDDLSILTIIMLALSLAVGIMNRVAYSSKSNEKGIKGIKGLVGFAVAMTLLLIPLKRMAAYSLPQLLKATTIMSAILLAYATSVKIMNGIKPKGIGKMATYVGALAALVFPIEALGNVKVSSLLKALSTITVFTTLFTAMVYFTKDLKIKSAIAIIATLAAFVKVFDLLAALINGPIAAMAPESFWKFIGISAVIAIFLNILCNTLIELKYTEKIAKKTKPEQAKNALKAVGATILVFAALLISLAVLTDIIRQAQSINWESAAKSLAVVLATMGALYGLSVAIIAYSKHITKTNEQLKPLIKNLAVFAGVFVGLLTSLYLISLVLNNVKQVDPRSALIAIGALLVLVGSSMVLLKMLGSIKIDSNAYKGIASLAAMFASLSVLLLSVAYVVKLSSKINANVGNTLLIFALTFLTAITTIALASKFSNQLAKVSKNIVLIAASFALFGLATAILAKGVTLLEGHFKALLIFAGLIATLAAAALLLAHVSTPLLTVAVVFGILGATVLAIGAGIYLLVTAINALLPNLDELAQKGDKIKTVLAAIIEGAMTGIANSIPVIVSKLMEALEIVIQNIMAKVTAIFDWLKNLDIKDFDEVIAKVCQIILSIIINCLDLLVKSNSIILDKLITIIINSVYTLISRLGEIQQALIDLVIGFIDNLGMTIEKNAARIRDCMINFCLHLWNAFLNFFGIKHSSGKAEQGGAGIVSNIIKGIGSKIRDAVNAIGRLFKSMGDGVREGIKKFKEWGKNVIEGFWNGIKEKWTGFKNWWQNLWKGFIDWWKNLFGIHSPSKLFYDFGQYTMEGYQNGINDSKDGVYNSMEDVYNEATEPWKDDSVYEQYAKQIAQCLADAIYSEEGNVYDSLEDLKNRMLTPFESQDTKTRFQEAIKQLLQVATEEIDATDLVIKPVMDIRDIQDKTRQAREMLSSISGVSISPTTQAASNASSNFNKLKAAKEQPTNNDNQTVTSTNENNYNVTFNITGNDPKSIADEVNKKFNQIVSRRKIAYGNS